MNTCWKDWCWSWSPSILVIWWEQPTHQKSPWCWERLRAEGEEGIRGWDGCMASPMKWTWTWENLGRWWGTGGLGCAAVHGVAKSETRLGRGNNNNGNSMFLLLSNHPPHWFPQWSSIFAIPTVYEGPNFSASSPKLIILVLLVITIIVGVKWYIMVIFICISLMAKDVQHLFLCFLDICTSALEEGLFKSFACCLIRLLIFLSLTGNSSLCMLESTPLSDLQMFLPLCGLSFQFLLFLSRTERRNIVWHPL